MSALISTYESLKHKLKNLTGFPLRLSTQDENRYRTQFLHDDAFQTSLGMIFFLVLVLPSFFNDYQFLGFSTTFYLMVTLRLASLAASILFIIFIRKVKNYIIYDRLLAVWQVLSLFVVLCINLTRPPDYYMFVAVDITIISTIYIVCRSRFFTQVVQALTFTAIDLSIVIITKDVPLPSLRAIIAGYILANGLGMSALWLLITARRREFLSHEQETLALKENQRLEEERNRQSRLESVGVLAGGIAHDFNNVLTGVIGNLELANEALASHNHNEARLRLVEAARASEHGKMLSKQLLTFAKGGVPAIQTVALPEVIREAVAFSLHGSTVTADINLCDGLWPVEADKSQISQVISNLVINARQAMPGGGLIKISARNITRGGQGEARGAKFVLVQVEDSGEGITPENLEHIFDPFFTTKESGYGLGLPVAYSIVKKHGGFIEAQSIGGAGTFFYVYLPASEKTPVKAETIPESTAQPGSGRILVMDDDEVIRRLFLKGIQQAGYTVDSASDGIEAVALYKKARESGQPYDAVVLDLTVPGGMGGQDVVKELYKVDPNVTAIASSGYSDNPVLSDYKRYGFRSALAKPYAISTLLTVLSKSLGESNG